LSSAGKLRSVANTSTAKHTYFGAVVARESKVQAHKEKLKKEENKTQAGTEKNEKCSSLPPLHLSVSERCS